MNEALAQQILDPNSFRTHAEKAWKGNHETRSYRERSRKTGISTVVTTGKRTMSDTTKRSSKEHLSLADLTDEERAMLPENGQNLGMFLTLIGARRLAMQRKMEGEAIEREPGANAGQMQPHETAKITLLPIFPQETRPTVNALARSALFAAIQGKDRQKLWNEKIASAEGVEIFFTGEQFNQDDHDTFMQLVAMASQKPLGEYVIVPAYAILKALGRSTGGSNYKQLATEIERLVFSGVKINTQKYEYFGHLIDYAVQDKDMRYWCYKLNESLRPLYDQAAYTLIGWEQRKLLKGKELSRWLHTEIVTHADPFPRSVAYLHEKSGSKTIELYKFRQMLKKALNNIKNVGVITSWGIDAADLVHVDRGATLPASQQHFLTKPKARRRPPMQARE